jgi:predicted hydrolase (HD superfamily)
LNDFISVNDTESLLKNGHDVGIIGRVFARQVSSDTEKWEGIGMVGGGAGSWMAEMAA